MALVHSVKQVVAFSEMRIGSEGYAGLSRSGVGFIRNEGIFWSLANQ